MPQKIVYEVEYKLIRHTRVNKIKVRIVGYIAWVLNLLFKVKIEALYNGEGVKAGGPKRKTLEALPLYSENGETEGIALSKKDIKKAIATVEKKVKKSKSNRSR